MPRWRRLTVTGFFLRKLNGEACAVWRDSAGKRHRCRLGVWSEEEGHKAFSDFARSARAAHASGRRPETVADVYEAYVADRMAEGKRAAQFTDLWKQLSPFFGAMSLLDVNPDRCREYAKMRFDLGRKTEAVWGELNRLRASLIWAVKVKLVVDAAVGVVWLPAAPECSDSRRV